MNKRPQRPGGGKRKPVSGDKQNFSRGEKPKFERGSKPKFSKDEKPKFERGGKPKFTREEKPKLERSKSTFSREEKPKFDSEDKPKFSRDDKPRFSRDNKFTKKVSHPHKPTKKKPELKPEPTHVRLNKYISNSGVCSRREADELIKDGKVSVNGKVVTEMGFQVAKTDLVKYEGKILKSEKLQYVLLNKPKGFITTMKDDRDRKTVMSLVEKACPERIYPVGRLDRNTTGLLLFTNDGELAKKLTHPSYNIKKIYQVELDKPITEKDFTAIVEGLELEDGEIKADELAVITDDKKTLGIQIHSGRNRIIRRIFEHLGYTVEKLDRVMFGKLTKKNLPRGKWRMLTDKEVGMMK